MLLWPAVSVVGFVLLAAVVVALAQSSTARYEFERNQVQRQRQRTAVPATVRTGAVQAGAVEAGAVQAGAVEAAGAGAVFGTMTSHVTEPGRRGQAAAIGVAHHSADIRVAEPGTPAWWLVEESAGGATTQVVSERVMTERVMSERVVAGPFDDRVDADWAALATGQVTGQVASVRAAHGVLRPDGRLVHRQLPAERAWLAELGEQLDRLPEEWDSLLMDEDELATLVVDVAAALVESGLPLHDCAGGTPAGGVCLTPAVGRQSVLVSWHQHDRMGREQLRGAATNAVVQRTMNAAIADCLQALGFELEPFGAVGCSLVAVAYPGS